VEVESLDISKLEEIKNKAIQAFAAENVGKKA